MRLAVLILCASSAIITDITIRLDPCARNCQMGSKGAGWKRKSRASGSLRFWLGEHEETFQDGENLSPKVFFCELRAWGEESSDGLLPKIVTADAFGVETLIFALCHLPLS